MRIKIIGDNNCARATRHLLRMAGFAVTEFLPAEAITQAPHHGYAITIELSPARFLPDASRINLGVSPTSALGSSTHGQSSTSNEEASALAQASADVSSPSFGEGVSRIAFSLRSGQMQDGETVKKNTDSTEKSAQGEAYATRVAQIHFDSVDSPLEAAILRHVTVLAAAPVVVDRPGGVVHSERELRIVILSTGDGKVDEAAAVAVEFGVLRGLLDLVTPHPPAILTDKSAAAPGNARRGGGKKWWRFGIVALLGALLGFSGNAQASPRREVEARGADGAYLHLEAALAPAAAQGQFADGQLNIALIGGAAVSGSLYDSGNTALKVNCVVGCGGAAGFSDNAAFSAGSTAVNNISAVFNDSITALASGNAGALRSTSDRMLYVNLGKLGGTALSGANVVDSGNTAFRVNCVVGCSASAGFTDNSAFTAGTTTETNLGGVFNDGLATLSSGNAAAARITAARALHVNLRNALGTEIGTASNPVRADPTGTTTQPVSVASLPALAAGSSTIGSVKITDGSNSIVVDPCKGQTKLYASINQIANTQLATGTSSKKIYICSIHVVVAAATNVALVEGTGSVCAIGTAGVSGFGGASAATGWNFMANGGIALGNGDASLGAEGTAADNLCLYNSGSGQVSGGISYVVQ
jgi:hypothetical protein